MQVLFINSIEMIYNLMWIQPTSFTTFELQHFSAFA